PDAPIARLRRDAQERAVAAGLDSLLQVGPSGRREDLPGEIAHHQLERHGLSARIERDAVEVVTGASLELNVQILALRAHRQRIVREQPLGDLRQAWEDAAEAEHIADRMQQLVRPPEISV